MPVGAAKFELKNQLSELHTLRRRLNDFLPAPALSERCRFQLHLILEEVFANIVTYAYCSSDDGHIAVTLKLEEDNALEVRIEDQGIAFNPLASPPPDLSANPEDRPVGGLGIHLVKKFADTVRYQRCGRRNVLTLRKRLEIQTEK